MVNWWLQGPVKTERIIQYVLKPLKCKLPVFGEGIWFSLFNSAWFENGSPYLQKQGVCGKLSVLAIDRCLHSFGMTYYQIWAYTFIRAGWADDLISRWLIPTFRLALSSIMELNTECVDTYLKPRLHRLWGCLICLSVTNRYWSPAPRVKMFILYNVFTKQQTSYKVSCHLVCVWVIATWVVSNQIKFYLSHAQQVCEYE